MGDTTDTQNLIRSLRTLRAVRAFRLDRVPEEVVHDLLEVARWTGSARNVQPWELVVVRSRESLDALAACDGYAGHLAGAQLGIVLVMSGENKNQETYDEGRLSERIMLAAAAHGVGASIGWFTGQGRADAKRLLGIPEHRLVRTAISLGFPDEEARRTRQSRTDARKPLSEIVHWERYGRGMTD